MFPAVAGLLIIITLLFLITNRNGSSTTELVQTTRAEDSGQSPSMGVVDKVMVPLALMSIPIRGSEKAFGDIRSRSDVFEENSRLKARIIELSDAEMRANALAMKVKRFEELLSAESGQDIPKQKIAARVVAENNGPFARSALLNVGAKSGARIGHAVMTENGMFGHVVAIGKRSSRVLLLQDINSRIAVMSVRSEARAIMVGTNGEHPNLLFVARDADWQDGDLIVTSGDEGVLPRGLTVGVMKQRGADKRNVVLASAGKPVDWVWVLPYVPVGVPEDEPVSEADLENLTPTEADLVNDQNASTTAATDTENSIPEGQP